MRARATLIALPFLAAASLATFAPTFAIAQTDDPSSDFDQSISTDLDLSDDGVWIEIDQEVASEIAAGNIEAIDQYLDPIDGVQADVLLEDFPTAHNVQVVDGLETEPDASSDSRLSTTIRAASVRVEKNPHGCQLLPYGTKGVPGGVMYMHKRTDSGPSQYGIIGWKPYVKCRTAPASIKNENLFYRTTIGGLWYPEAAGRTGIARNAITYQQKDITWKCKNHKLEDWRGRTLGTITAKNGKVYVAQQHTQKLTQECGI